MPQKTNSDRSPLARKERSQQLETSNYLNT
jgi:hypothetical protein